MRRVSDPLGLGLSHDLIDAGQPGSRPDRTYPVPLGALGFGG